MKTKERYPITSHMDNVRFHELAERIRSMSDISDLVANIRADSEMAYFCGCKCTDTDVVVMSGAKEQWRACRKGK